MRRVVFLVVLLAMIAVAGLAYANQAQRELTQTAQRFFSLAANGNRLAAAELSPELTFGESLLAALAKKHIITAGEIGKPRLLSLKRAAGTVELLLGTEKKAVHIPIEFTRTADGWKISGFTNLNVFPLALVTGINDDEVILLDAAGESHTFNGTPETPATPGHIGSAVTVENTLAYFRPMDTMEVNKLLTIRDDALEGEESGYLTLDNPVYFRLEDGKYRIAAKDDLIVGMRSVSVFQQDGGIRAVIIPDNFLPDHIRVVLNTTGFGGLGHKTVTLTANTPYSLVERITGETLRFAAAEELTFTPEGEAVSVYLPSGERRVFANRLFILPQNKGRIQVTTLRRGSPAFTPSYRGQMEVAEKDGSIVLVNEVPMESYLYSVVPSEMPVSFGLTPLKVQAVAARSYAVASILRSGFRTFAAHVDDSTASQVYNNVPEFEISNQAVNETAGMVVDFNGEIADTRFFSTSAGVTANFGETWHDLGTGDFPANPVPYLASRPQLADGIPDVSTEDGARAFFASAGWDAYDKASPWFRWEVELTRQEVEEVIAKYLPERQKAQPLFVLTYDGEGFGPMNIPEDPLGELTDIRVISRGTGGNIMEMEIEGTKGKYRLVREFTIRFTLRPVKVGGGRDITLQRHDGSELKNYTILPSAFVVIDFERDNQDRITTVRFRGGGNGHGVGMSQWGTRGLAEAGRSYNEILAHYYPGTILKKAY